MFYYSLNLTQREKIIARHSIRAYEKSQLNRVQLSHISSSCRGIYHSFKSLSLCKHACPGSYFLLGKGSCICSVVGHSCLAAKIILFIPSLSGKSTRSIKLSPSWKQSLKEPHWKRFIRKLTLVVPWSLWVFQSKIQITLYMCILPTLWFLMSSGWASIYTVSLILEKWFQEAPCSSYLLLHSTTLLTLLTQRNSHFIMLMIM